MLKGARPPSARLRISCRYIERKRENARHVAFAAMRQSFGKTHHGTPDFLSASKDSIGRGCGEAAA
jgi:hypothetical protein